ncbi:hypothetical protein ABW48_12485 [Pluralibacter gergoviae]|nr:hypothetical protein ABW48_12485 [Pluralibacter gergoviae]
MRIAIVLLLAATLALLFTRIENNRLRRDLNEASQLAGAQKLNLDRLNAERAALDDRLKRTDALQQAWRQKLNAAADASARREQTIARLLNENSDARRWYGSALPDAVRRMHQRPACASAGRCLQPLPAGDALPDAGKQPDH